MSKIVNAIIDHADIRIERNLILTCNIDINYGDSSHQRFGGHALYINKNGEHHNIKAFAGHFINRVMEIAGVESFSELKGKSIRVVKEDDSFNSMIIGIGHIIKDDWFYPNIDFKEARNE